MCIHSKLDAVSTSGRYSRPTTPPYPRTVELTEKIADGLRPGTGFVPSRHVSDLDVSDQGKVRVQALDGIVARHRGVILVELQPEARMLDGLHQTCRQ